MDELEFDIKVILRPYDQDLDEAMIYATWRNSAWYSSNIRHQTTPNSFFKSQSIRIKNILSHAQVRIACLELDPATIIGYSVSLGDHLAFVYVKSDFRNKGIGSMLVPQNIKTYTSQLTKIGFEIVNKKNLITKEN